MTIKKISRLFYLLTAFEVTSTAFSQDISEKVAQGQHEVQKGNYETVISYFNEAVEIDPEYLDAYAKRAFAHSMLQEYEKAISDYTRLIELNPNFVIAYLSRGSAYNKLERYKEALADFDKVIILAPSNSEAFNNRGWSKKGLGDKKGACADWKTSKKMGNEEAKIILKNNQC